MKCGDVFFTLIERMVIARDGTERWISAADVLIHVRMLPRHPDSKLDIVKNECLLVSDGILVTVMHFADDKKFLRLDDVESR